MRGTVIDVDDQSAKNKHHLSKHPMSKTQNGVGQPEYVQRTLILGHVRGLILT